MTANGRDSLGRFWIAQQLVGFLAVLMLGACDTDSGSFKEDDTASTVSVALPATVKPQQLPDGKLEAYIIIDSDENNRKPLEVGEEKTTGSITVKTGTRNFEVVFEWVESANQERWELVRSAQTVEVMAGEQSLAFDRDSYIFQDNDADGSTNVEELKYRTDPNDSSSVPIKKQVFVTSATGTGNLSSWSDSGGKTGIAAGDAICQTRAAAAGFTGTFVAWLSDDKNDSNDENDDDAYCRVHNLLGKKSNNCGLENPPEPAGPWIRTDGFPFGEAADKLFTNDGIVYAPVRHDEFGNLVSGSTFFFTATSEDGTFAKTQEETVLTSCGSWTSDDSEKEAKRGLVDGTTDSWTDWGKTDCDDKRALLCFETGVGSPLPLADFTSEGKKVFVTSTFGTGDLNSWSDSGGNTGIEAGDAICRARARAGGLENPEKFKAWLSNDFIPAKDRIQDGTWIRPDGILVASSLEDLLDGSLFTAITVDEKKGYPGNRFVWTGTEFFGDRAGDNCSNWTSASEELKGVKGRSSFAGEGTLAGWSNDDSVPCNNNGRLYCFED